MVLWHTSLKLQGTFQSVLFSIALIIVLVNVNFLKLGRLVASSLFRMMMQLMLPIIDLYLFSPLCQIDGESHTFSMI